MLVSILHGAGIVVCAWLILHGAVASWKYRIKEKNYAWAAGYFNALFVFLGSIVQLNASADLRFLTGDTAISFGFILLVSLILVIGTFLILSHAISSLQNYKSDELILLALFIFIIIIVDSVKIFEGPNGTDFNVYHGHIINMLLEGDWPSDLENYHYYSPAAFHSVLAVFVKFAGSWGLGFGYYIPILLLLLLAYVMMRDLGVSKLFAFIAMFVIWTLPATVYMTVSGHVEIIMAYLVLSNVAIISKIDDLGFSHYALLAVSLAALAIVKYYGLYAAAILAFATIVYTVRKDSVVGLRMAAFVGSLSFLLIAPYYLLNYLAVGDPVYPALTTLLNPNEADLFERYKDWVNSTKNLAGTGLWDFFMYPLRLTFAGDEYLSGKSGLGPLLPVWLAICIIFVFNFRHNSSTCALLCYVFLCGLAISFFLTIQRARHLYPYVIPAIILFSVYLADGVKKVAEWRLFFSCLAFILAGSVLFQMAVKIYSVSTLWRSVFTEQHLVTKELRNFGVSIRQRLVDLHLEHASILTFEPKVLAHLPHGSRYISPMAQGKIDYGAVSANDLLYYARSKGLTFFLIPLQAGELAMKSGNPIQASYYEIASDILNEYGCQHTIEFDFSVSRTDLSKVSRKTLCLTNLSVK